MKLVTIGDSITKGTYTAFGDDSPNSIAKPYGAILSELLECDFVNYGLNGISYSRTSPVNSEYSLDNKIDEYELGDILIVAAGTNDFGTNVGLKDFKEAVDYVFSSIKKRKHDNVYILPPLPRIDEKKNDIGNSLNNYRNIVKDKTREYGYKLIDIKNFKIDPSDRSYMYDGVHLNDEAHILLANYILEFIKRG